MVTGTNKWTAGNFFEAHSLGDFTQLFKLLRRYVTLDWQVALARLKVLSQRQEIAIITSQIAQALQQLVTRFQVGF